MTTEQRIAKGREIFLKEKLTKKNLKNFLKYFKDYKCSNRFDREIYLIYDFTEEEKIQFLKLNSSKCSGGGYVYGNKYCNDHEYRTEYSINNIIILT